MKLLQEKTLYQARSNFRVGEDLHFETTAPGMEDTNREGSSIHLSASVSSKSVDGAKSGTGNDLLGVEEKHYNSGSGADGNEKAIPNSKQAVSFFAILSIDFLTPHP